MISVVIPAYNEGAAIEATVREVHEAIRKCAGITEYEILVVDDGSTDDTLANAKLAGATTLHNPHNIGYGWSLKRGIQTAKFDTLCIVDADLTYPIDQLGTLIAVYREGYDMVVGQRTGKLYHESLLKAPLRVVVRFLVEYATGRKIPDVNSGFRIFSRKTAMQYFNHLCNTFSFTTSMTLAYMMNGRFVHYCKIPYRARTGKSKVLLFRDSLRTFQYIVEAVVYFNPLKLFALLSLMYVLAAFASFFSGAMIGINAPYYLGIGLLIIAVLTISLGFVAVLLKQIMMQGLDQPVSLSRFPSPKASDKAD